MTLEQLRVFVEVAGRLHVTAAAAALGMTQSAASASLRALEARLGAALFDRVGRRVELTEAGRVFLPEARAVLARAEAAEGTLADLAGLRRGRLRLWASQTVGGYWLPPLIARFRAAHPGVGITLEIGNTEEVARAVLAGVADLGVVEGEVGDALLVRVDVGSDRLVAVASPGLAVPALGRADWVMRERGSGTRQVVEGALRGHGIDPGGLAVVLELPSNEAVRSAVEAGAGVTVLSRLVVDGGLAAGRLRELEGLGVEGLGAWSGGWWRRFSGLCPEPRQEAAPPCCMGTGGGPGWWRRFSGLCPGNPARRQRLLDLPHLVRGSSPRRPWRPGGAWGRAPT